VSTDIRDPGLERLTFQDLHVKVDSRRLREQLRYVMDTSPFYNRKYRRLKRDPDYVLKNFAHLPFTTKEEVIRDQVSHPPFGSNLCAADKAVVRVHRTSGTTNRPVVIAMTAADVQATVASGARCFWASGLRPHHTVVHCLNYCLWAGGYTDHQSLEATGATVVPFGVGNSKALVEAIRELRVDAVHCTPSYLQVLEELLARDFGMKPSDLGLRLGLFGGEGGVGEQAFRQRIEHTWGFKAMNANYGMADVLSMFGAECGLQQGLHFMGQGNLLVELIDPKTLKLLPVEAGVTGELVLTNINRQAQPVIRFRTRDLISIRDHNVCACGRGSFRFDIVGRSDDMLVVKGVNIFPGLVKGRLARFRGKVTGCFQIVVDTPPPLRELYLRVEYSRTLKAMERRRLLESLSDDFQTGLSVRPRIELVPEGTLPRTHGKTGFIQRREQPSISRSDCVRKKD
jgi:phenylacetate-CoA ligase